MDRKILTMIDKNEVWAIVPARSGSRGVKNKNIRSLNGYPMMAYSIAAAELCPEISRIIVSTDSEQYAAIAKYYGAETPFLRPAEYAGDRSTDMEFMAHAIEWLSANEGRVPEYFVHLRPTYPLREVDIVSGAVREMRSDTEATSLRSAHQADFSPYKWFTMGENGYFRCLFEEMTPDEANNPRQDFPVVYIPDGYVDVLRTSAIVESGLLHGEKIHAYIVPAGTDVDTPHEMREVERRIAGEGQELYRYLREHYKVLEEAGMA